MKIRGFFDHKNINRISHQSSFITHRSKFMIPICSCFPLSAVSFFAQLFPLQKKDAAAIGARVEDTIRIFGS